ncbi:MAG: 30S ribosomal protein S3ae [Thermoplasmata archaeon]|jgi:small subunit ribosomal protein S3Ae|nr:30S ribosomal protein S3ae [Thermoplasmata archaeon]MBR4684987.1 30S ribosomal protein S3ae [Candidatus Methanomethylophilaceae archaeon]WII06937.1 30S ribosomal protein S3ae [Methanomassiliicoccales archaeon LGM-RCC1]
MARQQAARKVKDKWKAKEWYKIHAPKMFNEAEIGDTPSADPEYVIGRTVEVTVQDLTGDFSKMHIKLKFKVNATEGTDAKTVFVGHDLTSDYVRRLTRRRKTKTDHVVDFYTKDGFKYRVKTMSIADRRIQSSQEEGMRAIISETLTNMGKEMTLSEIVKAIINGTLSRDLAKACHVIIPIKRIEIRKSEVLEFGEGEPEAVFTADEMVSTQAPEAAAPAEETAEEAPAEESEEAPAEEASE